jgi:uncharacterized protein
VAVRRAATERFEGLTRAIGGVTTLASRYAVATLLVVAFLTLALGAGLGRLHTNVDVADVLPRGDGNTTAAHDLTTQFKSAFTLQITLQFHVDDGPGHAQWAKDNRDKLGLRQTPPRPDNITDEVYIRAVEQAIAYMKTQDDLICCSISVSDLYRLINWTLEGGQQAPDSAYGLPDRSLAGESRYRAVNDSAGQAILSAIDALASPTWRDTAVLLTPLPDTTASTAEIGERAIRARDAYVQWAEDHPDVAYQVFTKENFPRLTVEMPVANAHSSELTKEDFSRLLPLIAGFILAMLFLAFRNLGAILISFTSLAIGVVWTYGVEGYLGIALNPLNLTLMPLIMGVGIDYSIHVVNEFLEHKSHGMNNETAFREVGRRAGVALFIGTSTTVAGLAVMMVSPSLLIAQFGGLAALAIAVIFLLALTFIPAALTLWPGTERMGASFQPSKLVPGVARLVTLGRVFVIVGVLVVSVVATVASLGLYNEAFGDPGRNYLESDPVRQEHEEGLKWFYDLPEPDVKANVIAFKGDLTNPQAHTYMRAIERELKKQPSVISDTLRTIPFLMETWLTVKGGGPGAVQYLGQGRAGIQNYPATAQDIQRELDGLYASPMKELGSIFTNGPNGHYTLGVMTFSVRAATYKEAEEVWHQVWRAIDNASASKPAGLQVAFVGNTATNYLFVAKEVPWVLYMGTFATIGLMLIVIPFFRSVRAVLAVGLVSFATTAWWLGLLPSLGIGMAITLVIPTIFIISLGTDYSVHLIWSIRKIGDVRQVFASTGKSILFSWLTTVGPFLIFIGIQDLSVRKTMVATALAVTIIFVVTLLVIPSFYRVRSSRELPATALPPETEVFAAERPR